MKKIKLKALKFILMLALILGTLTTSVFGWFSSKYNTISTRITGSIVFEYFHRGKGTQDDPFVITRPIHYYHMVEFFQRTTVLKISAGESASFGKEYIYFQIGCPLAQLADPTNTNNPVSETDWYVFDYTNAGGVNEYNGSGTVVPGTNVLASKTLNMAYYSGERALMPIGSSQIPFLGLIDGHMLTIDNLHIVSHSVVNVQDENGIVHQNIQRNTADMGVFGCIAQGIDINGDGSIADDLEEGLHEASSVKNLYITNATIDLEGTASTTEMVGDLPTLPNDSPTHSNDYHLVDADGNVVENGTAVAYVGYIAGHVYSTEGVIEHVYVNNCRIVGGSKAISGYGYFGVIIDPTTSEVVSSLGSQIANIYTQGEGSGFGGSIGMSDLYTRINTIYGYNQTIKNITAETVIVDEVAGTIKKVATAYSTTNAKGGASNDGTATYIDVYYYYTPEVGAYYFMRRNSGTDWYANYLYGENSRQETKTITTITYEKDLETGSYKTIDGYKIYEGTSNYLGTDSSFNLISTTSQNAVALSFDNSNHLYFVAKVPFQENYDYPFEDYDETSNVGYIDTIYYINASNNNLGVTASTNASSVWAMDGTRFYTTSGNTRYYLDYDKGSWYLTPVTSFYILSDEDGDYLKIVDTTLDSTTLEEEASKIEIANPGSSTTISTVINGSRYYFRNNNGVLQFSTTASNNTWSYDSTNEAYYITIGSTKYYLSYFSGSWILRPEGYLYQISDNRNFLNATSTTTFNNVIGGLNASFWNLNPNQATTTISTVVQGTVTYLGVNNNGALALGTTYSSTVWTKDGDAYYVEINGSRFYLGYENDSWRIGLTGYKIFDGSNYLNANSTTTVNGITTGAENASTWVYDPDANSTEFYTFYNGTKVYLSRNGYNLAASTSSTTWTKDANGYYLLIDGIKFYLVFKNNAWALEHEGYKIYDNTTNYLRATSATAFDATTEANSSTWIFDPNQATTTIATIYNGTKTYLGRNGYNLALNTSYSSTVWTKDANGYYLLIDGIKFYLVFKNNAWALEYEGYEISANGANYLRATSATTFDATTKANASTWILDSNAASTAISTIYNNTKTYLGVNNGTLALGTGYSSTTWTKDGDNYYTLVAGERAYLVYDSGWKIKFDGYKISNGSTAFLTATSTTAFGNNTEANASIWFIDTTQATSTISTIYNGTKTYLGVNNGTLALGTGYSSTTWTKDGNHYYTTVYGEKAYIVYENNAWKIQYDGYRISNGSTAFLRVTSTTAFGNTTEANASIWFIDTTQATSTIYTLYNGTKTYLGRNGYSLAVNTSYSSTIWTKDGNNYYIDVDGCKLYLSYSNNAWTLVYDSYRIRSASNSTNYLTSSTTTISNSTNGTNFIMDMSSASTTISFINGTTRYYLGINEDNAQILVVGTGYNNVLWQKDSDNLYYTNYNGINYYIAYIYNNWRAIPKEYVRFTSNNVTMYIYSTTRTRNTASPGNTANFYHDSQNRYYGFYNNTKYFLQNNDYVYVSTTVGNAATLYRENNYLYVLDNNARKYITQVSTQTNTNNAWRFQAANASQYVITDGEGNYLQVTGPSSFTNANSYDDATKFTFSSTTSGTISTTIGNTRYYLYNSNNTLAISTSSTTWTIGTGSISNNNYGIMFADGVWKLLGNCYVLKTGTNSYMGYSGTNTNVVDSKENANILLFESVPAATSSNVTIRVIAGNNAYYLYCGTSNGSGVTLSNNTRSWRYDGTRLWYRGGGTSYYLQLNGSSWQINNQQSSAATITFEKQYNYTTNIAEYSQGTNNMSDYTGTYTQAFTETIATKNASLNAVDKNGVYTTFTATKNMRLEAHTITNNFTYKTYAPSYAFSTSQYSSVRTITIDTIDFVYVLSESIPLVINYNAATQKTFTVTTQSNQKTGFTTYMPIRVPLADESDYDASSPFKASLKNTGYIIAGGNYYDSSTNGTRTSDIRVSRYAKSNISSYQGTIETLYTVTLDNNTKVNRALTSNDTKNFLSFNDATAKDTDEEGNEIEITVKGAKSQFDEMIGSNADGLHFMNAAISMDHILTVPQATILNRTYYNYQLPEDCIDFKVLKRGAISFFAGEYFTNNNAFFSLHQIFRDSNQNITAIREIKNVYKLKGAAIGTADYIYLYKRLTGETVDMYGRINQDTGEFEVVTMEIIGTNVFSHYELAFDTDWITNPTGLSNSNKHVYYFEIPCNKGEYALGSVEGKVGAYLLYLDIAANGGDEVGAVVSGQGNDVSTSFKVDFRSPGQESDFAIMQLFISCPLESDAASTAIDNRLFNVNVVFDNTETGEGIYSEGIYNIYITNKVPSSTAKIDIFLVDDDNDVMTQFPYAYRVIYTNLSYTDTTIITSADLDYYQAVSSFEIPSEGPAIETAYN